jgi:hypothetical protein
VPAANHADIMAGVRLLEASNPGKGFRVERCTCPDPAPSPGAPLAVPTVTMSPECCINAHARCERSWQGQPCACGCHDDPQTPGAREAAQRADEAECHTHRCTNPECDEGYDCYTPGCEPERYLCDTCAAEQDCPCPDCAQRADEAELHTDAAAADEILRRYTLEMDAVLMDTRAHILNHDTPSARADEAELQAGLLATLPPMAGGAPTCFYCEHHGDGVVPATRQIAFVDNDAPRAEWVCDACARAYFPAAQLGAPPMDGGGITYQLWKHDTSGDVYVVAIENYGTIVSAAGPLDHSTYAQALAGDFDDDHELRDDLIANNGFYTVYQPPIAGGAPSHYDDPAWYADEAWALQEERNAESARMYRCPACAHSYPTDDAMMACFDSHVPEHTHPCPTCHQARPCTATGCADGPRECATCSNCRGW